jgi:N6-adenosine-specific RNA methylase IME4
MESDLIVTEEKRLSLGLPGTWEATGWVAPEQLDFDDWEAIGPLLRSMEGAVHWWIGDWLNYGEYKWGEMYAQAMDETGFQEQTLTNDVWVSRHIEFSRRRENLSWSHHAEVATLEAAEQDYWLEQAENEGWTRNELRRQLRAAQPKLELPQDKYRVLYADPPWHYDQVIEKYGPAERHYPTMTTDEICAMGAEIAPITTNDAVLFLWSTAPKLKDALGVAESWGFKYSGAQFVWDKVKHNYGHYNSVRHELLLICTKGSCTPDTSQLFDSVQTIERTDEHSEKPEEFRQIIDTLYTQGKRIELFARKRIEGWESWGNEIP